jgi:heme/copper-type cytochrome/quinol oxidase subunit 4
VYALILGIALLQIVIAYQNIDGSQRFLRMLLLAVVQASLAITFFMHMKSEKPIWRYSSCPQRCSSLL